MTPIIAIIFAVVAVAAGMLAGWLIVQRQKSSLTNDLQQATSEQAVLKAQLEMVEAQKQAALDEMRKHYEALSQEKEQRHADHVASLERHNKEALESHIRNLEEQKQHYEARLSEQEQRHGEATQALEERFNAMVKMVKEQMENATGKMLKERQAEFATTSKTNLDNIVNPLKETIEKMKEEMAKNSTVQTTMSAEIKTNMEHMIRQSIEAQRSAEELTRAFKHESKTQGNWGEVVLSNLLASQGFTEGKDFETQQAMRDADGNIITNEEGGSMIPDVLLHLDGERDVIIDSKVSMTAYINYVNAEDEATKRQYLREHIVSLRKHVDELAAKNYTQYQVAPHIDFVIMFVPQVQALWVATNKEPSLWQDAMQQRVFIADEQTLYAALRIIRITWTHIDQERNHKELFKLAQEMLNRTGDFLEKFDVIGRDLKHALDTFEDGKKKLLPGGYSIGTTARQILQLSGVSNRRNSKSKRAPEAIIPAEYIGDEELPFIESTSVEEATNVPSTKEPDLGESPQEQMNN